MMCTCDTNSGCEGGVGRIMAVRWAGAGAKTWTMRAAALRDKLPYETNGGTRADQWTCDTKSGCDGGVGHIVVVEAGSAIAP